MRENPHSIYYLIPLLLTVLILTIPTSEAVNISGYFEPSGMYGGHSGYYSWENYCPLCGDYGTLADNPKRVPEGEITCLSCSADYDGCTGLDKWEGGARAKLRPAATTSKTEPEFKNQLESKTQLETLQDTIKEHNSLVY